MALAHFALGAALTTLLVTFLVPGVWYPRSVILAGGAWAMIPDLHWISPIATDRLREFHNAAVWTDLFWFHRSLDRADPTDSKATAALFLVLLFAATAIAERRGYRALASVEAAYESYADADPTE